MSDPCTGFTSFGNTSLAAGPVYMRKYELALRVRRIRHHHPDRVSARVAQTRAGYYVVIDVKPRYSVFSLVLFVSLPHDRKSPSILQQLTGIPRRGRIVLRAGEPAPENKYAPSVGIHATNLASVAPQSLFRSLTPSFVFSSLHLWIQRHTSLIPSSRPSLACLLACCCHRLFLLLFLVP